MLYLLSVEVNCMNSSAFAGSHTFRSLQGLIDANEDIDACVMCKSSMQPSEEHLDRRYFKDAVHFQEDGVGEFRSTWSGHSLVDHTSDMQCIVCDLSLVLYGVSTLNIGKIDTGLQSHKQHLICLEE